MNKNAVGQLVFFTVLLGVFLGGVYLYPWSKMTWGRIEQGQVRTIKVVGSADTETKNEIANFSATVSSINDKKEEALKEVNTKVEELMKALKVFGLKDEDLKTSNLSIYQQEETYYEDGRQKSRPGQWRVSNTVEITLRQVDQANALAEVLSKSGATNVWGPNFGLDGMGKLDEELMKLAMKDATEKAGKLANNAGVSLGKVVSIEDSADQPVINYREMGGGGGGGATLPGTSKVSKYLTVVFEIN